MVICQERQCAQRAQSSLNVALMMKTRPAGHTVKHWLYAEQKRVHSRAYHNERDCRLKGLKLDSLQPHCRREKLGKRAVRKVEETPRPSRRQFRSSHFTNVCKTRDSLRLAILGGPKPRRKLGKFCHKKLLLLWSVPNIHTSGHDDTPRLPDTNDDDHHHHIYIYIYVYVYVFG